MGNELLDELNKVKVDDVTAELAQLIRDYKNPKFSTRPPTKFVFPSEATPMEQENAVINYFFDNWAPKKKNLYKIATRIYAQVPRFIQRSILDHILDRSVDPVDFMVACFDEKARWANIIEHMLKEGNHGVIYTDDHGVFGFDLTTNPRWLKDKQQKRWHPDDELEIMKETVKIWEKKHGQVFDGKIMLFPEYGFSGMPRKL